MARSHESRTMRRTKSLLWQVLMVAVPISGFTPAYRLKADLKQGCLHAGDGNPPPFGDYVAQQQQAAVGQQVPPSPEISYQAPPAQQQQSSPMNANDPMSTIQTSQTEIVRMIQAKIPDLKLSSLSTNHVEGYDAPGSSNIAWLANVQVPQSVSSLTVFHGPLTYVPHIVDRVEFEQGNLRWYCDVRPRAYGAYETRDEATGEYPGPEVLGRKAFEYSGARNEFATKFGNVEQLLQMNQFEGAIALPMDTSEAAVLTTGPLVVNIQFPATEGNVQTLLRVRQGVAEAWLRWSTEEQHDHRPGAPINSQYVYDAKFRQNAFLALRNMYSRLFDPDQAQTLAIAESGPLDEAYVGGGS